MLIAANFHYIREDFSQPCPSIFGVTSAEFVRQLELLGTAGDFVSASDIVDALDGRRALPDRAILVTFDDGLAEQFALAWPILQAKRIPAIFFANTACIADGTVETVHQLHILRSLVSPATILEELAAFSEADGIGPLAADAASAAGQYQYDDPEAARLKYALNTLLSIGQQLRFARAMLAKHAAFDEHATSRELYMSRHQLRELDAHGAVGTHGHRHVQLGRLPHDAAARDVACSLDLLASWGCRSVASLSYPYGTRQACSMNAARSAEQRGVRFGFTMERAGNPNLTQPMFLSRFSNSDLPGGNAAQYSAGDLFARVASATWFRD